MSYSRRAPPPVQHLLRQTDGENAVPPPPGGTPGRRRPVGAPLACLRPPMGPVIPARARGTRSPGAARPGLGGHRGGARRSAVPDATGSPCRGRVCAHNRRVPSSGSACVILCTSRAHTCAAVNLHSSRFRDGSRGPDGCAAGDTAAACRRQRRNYQKPRGSSGPAAALTRTPSKGPDPTVRRQRRRQGRPEAPRRAAAAQASPRFRPAAPGRRRRPHAEGTGSGDPGPTDLRVFRLCPHERGGPPLPQPGRREQVRPRKRRLGGRRSGHRGLPGTPAPDAGAACRRRVAPARAWGRPDGARLGLGPRHTRPRPGAASHLGSASGSASGKCAEVSTTPSAVGEPAGGLGGENPRAARGHARSPGATPPPEARPGATGSRAQRRRK